MEITPEMLDNLSPEDLDRVAEYKKLREKAKNDAFNIRDTYVFRVGEKWRVVNHTTVLSLHSWVLTRDGVWVLTGADPTCDLADLVVRVAPDSLFDLYKAADEAERMGVDYRPPVSNRSDVEKELGTYELPERGWCCVAYSPTDKRVTSSTFLLWFKEFLRFVDWTEHTPKYTLQVPPESYVYSDHKHIR